MLLSRLHVGPKLLLLLVNGLLLPALLLLNLGFVRGVNVFRLPLSLLHVHNFLYCKLIQVINFHFSDVFGPFSRGNIVFVSFAHYAGGGSRGLPFVALLYQTWSHRHRLRVSLGIFDQV